MNRFVKAASTLAMQRLLDMDSITARATARFVDRILVYTFKSYIFRKLPSFLAFNIRKFFMTGVAISRLPDTTESRIN